MENNVLTLVSYKQWYIPADVATYQFLVNLGFPSTRIHEDLMPMLKMIAKKNGIIKITGRPFAKIMDAMMDQVGAFWLKSPNRDAHLMYSQLVFTTTKPDALEKAKTKSLPRLELALRKFFQRWGFVPEFQYSESRSKIKLVVTYSFVQHRKPIIPIKVSARETEATILQLGFSRILFNTDKKYLHWRLERKQADTWAPITAGKSLHTEISDPTAAIIMLLSSFNEN